MTDANKQALLSAVRSLLIIAGSSLAAHGAINADSVGEAVGAIMAIIPLVWGVWDKYRAENVARGREAVAVNVGIVVADATVGPTPLVTIDDAPHIIATVSPTLPAGPTETVAPEIQSKEPSP